MVKLLNIIILYLILLSSEAYAINMGSVVKNNFAKVTVNESVRFTILFWNIENESYSVRLNTKSVPENWATIIEPNNFVLNSSVGTEYIKLPYKKEAVKVTSVDVIVKPYYYERPGRYNLTVTAESQSPKDGIGFSQERVFNLFVEVENPLFFEKQNENVETPLSSENTNQGKNYQNLSLDTIRQQENSHLNYLYVIIIILIFLISYLIYKYS